MSRKTALSRARPFLHTREHHGREAAEDYTELVAELITEHGEARLTDLAKRLGISHVTAHRTVKRLVREGFLTAPSRAPIGLTRKGSDLAKFASHRHAVLLQFLTTIGVPVTVAEIEVEGLEHHIGRISLRAIEEWLTKSTDPA